MAAVFPVRRSATAIAATASFVFCVVSLAGQVPDSRVSGVVLSKDGLALVGATVALVSDDGVARQSTTTTLDGTFSFSVVGPGRYHVRVSKPGYLDGELGARAPGLPGTPLALRPQAAPTHLTIALWKGGVITGVVRDHLGAPLSGVDVFAVTKAPANSRIQTGWLRTSAVTDGNGSYRLFGLEPAQYVVGARRRAPGRGAIGLPTSQQIDAAIAQLATGRQGAPISLAADVYAAASAFYPGVADPAFAQVVPVSASEERAGVDVTLSVARTTAIRGLVRRPDGGSVLGTRIGIRRDDDLPLPPDLETAPEVTQPRADGSFMISSLIPGRYLITAVQAALGDQAPRRPSGSGAPGFWARRSLQVSADSTQPGVTLDMQPTLTISGELRQSIGPTNQVDSTTLAGVVLGARPVERMFPEGETYLGSVRGQRFEIKGILPGSYEVFVTAHGTQRQRAISSVARSGRYLPDEIVAVGSADLDDLVVVLTDRPTEVSGTLFLPDGSPTSDYYVIAYPEDRGLWPIAAKRVRAVRPATDAKYIIRGLPPGLYRLAVFPADVRDDWLDPIFLESLAGRSISMRLEPGAPLVLDLKIGR